MFRIATLFTFDFCRVYVYPGQSEKDFYVSQGKTPVQKVS